MMGMDHSANVLHLFTPKELCSAQLTNEALWAFFPLRCYFNISMQIV